MNLLELSKSVKDAELEAKAHADRARDAWKDLKTRAGDAATPWRIVTVGVIGGFLVGRRDPAAGPSVGGKLFGSIAQSLVTALGASLTAGAAASSAADAAAAATTDATVGAAPAATADATVRAATVGAAPAATVRPPVAEMADLEDRDQ